MTSKKTEAPRKIAADKGHPVYLESYPGAKGFYEHIGFKPSSAGGTWMEFSAPAATVTDVTPPGYGPEEAGDQAQDGGAVGGPGQ